MRVNQSAEAKIAQRSSPVPLTMADDHSVSVNTHRQIVHSEVCMHKAAENKGTA